ncbi:hypothetical protein PspLS_07963 [Pyricularia sp. CBS 133598]|nr:hypothetical protein PspLS_07963 [Pyricularia sp. CBS 133598]
MATDPCPPHRLIPQLTIGGLALFWFAQTGMADRLQGDGGTVLTSPLLGARRAIQSIITVGKNGREFVPNITSAWAGDVIEFHFYPGNYSVSPAKWRLTLPDSNAVFFYSSAGDDCNRYAMVGGINVMEDQLQMQHDMALDSPSVVQPSAASHPTINSVPSTSASNDPQTAQPEMPIGVIEKSEAKVGPAWTGRVEVADYAGHERWQWKRPQKRRLLVSRQEIGYRAGNGTADGVRGEDVQDYEKQHGTDRWQLEDAQTSIFSNSHHHHHNHSPPLGAPALQQPRHLAAVPAPPIIDGDTIYVPVHRSTIMSADYGGPSPSHYTPPRSPPPNSPVSMAAQMLHRRWLAQEQIDASDAESGVFGIGVRRFPSTASEEPRSSAGPNAQGSMMAGKATLHEGMETAASAPQSPLPPLPDVAEARLEEEVPDVEQHGAAAAEIPARCLLNHQGRPGGLASQEPQSAGAMAISGNGDVSSPGTVMTASPNLQSQG